MKSIKLLRPVNLLFLGLSISLIHFVLLANFSADIQISTYQFWLFLLSCLFMAAGGNIINDFYDVEIDKINRPNRPLVTASPFKLKVVYRTGVLMLFISVCLGFWLGNHVDSVSFGFFYFFAALALMAYSQKLKRQLLSGNFLVSLLTALPYFLLFYLIKINHPDQVSLLIYRIFLFLMIMSFLLNFIREIIKDLEDIKGDFSINSKTLPIQLGRQRTHFIIQLIIILTLLTVLICSLYFFDSYLAASCFAVGIGIPLIVTAYKIRKVRLFINYRQLSQLLKLSMLIGLLILIFLPQTLQL